MKQTLLIGLALVLLPVMASSPAGRQAWHESESSYNRAREAVRRGEALPLYRIRPLLPRVMPGQVVAIDYEHEFDRWVYEFKVINLQGQLRAVHLDARTGELVEITDY